MLGTSAAKALRRCCGNGPFPAAPSILDFDHCSKASAVRLASRLAAFCIAVHRND